MTSQSSFKLTWGKYCFGGISSTMPHRGNLGWLAEVLVRSETSLGATRTRKTVTILLLMPRYVAKLSIESGIPSEYTIMTFRIEAVEQNKKQKHNDKGRSRTKNEGITLVHYAKLGFGNQIATLENLPPCCEEEPKVPNTFAAFDKAVGCCSSFCDCFCCVCFIKTCSKMSDQCMIALAQLCSALSCLACSECCAEVCFDS